MTNTPCKKNIKIISTLAPFLPTVTIPDFTSALILTSGKRLCIHTLLTLETQNCKCSVLQKSVQLQHNK